LECEGTVPEFKVTELKFILISLFFFSIFVCVEYVTSRVVDYKLSLLILLYFMIHWSPLSASVDVSTSMILTRICVCSLKFSYTTNLSSGKADDERLQSSIQCRVIREEGYEDLEYS
jgi:hypothetical protein